MAFQERETRSLSVYFIASVAALGGFLFGFDTGGHFRRAVVSETKFCAPATFWLYACFGVLAFLFSWILVPETKGRSLEQIERYWENGRHWDKAA